MPDSSGQRPCDGSGMVFATVYDPSRRTGIRREDQPCPGCPACQPDPPPPGAEERGLLIVAVRVDHPREVAQRIKTILAVAATYDDPPDSTPSVWCKRQSEMVAADLDRLAGFIGWDRVRDLNVGDVVSPGAAQEESDGE